MTDDEQDHIIPERPARDWSRRDFVALSVAAGQSRPWLRSCR